SAALFSLLGTPAVSLDYADAQYSSGDDDDDDDDDDRRGNAGSSAPASAFNDGRVNDDVAAPVAIFCEQGDMAFYSAIGRGNARLSQTELLAGVQEATVLGGSARVLDTGAATVDISSNRTVTIYAAQADGSTYQTTVRLAVCGGITPAQINAAVQAVEEEAEETSSGAAVSEDGTYTVQPGDSLSSIAREFGTSVNALVEANGIEDPDRIVNGQTLIIP
ncbi:MAG: LysM domain-containing protein, partial [Chloroflexota bacterium]